MIIFHQAKNGEKNYLSTVYVRSLIINKRVKYNKRVLQDQSMTNHNRGIDYHGYFTKSISPDKLCRGDTF